MMSPHVSGALMAALALCLWTAAGLTEHRLPPRTAVDVPTKLEQLKRDGQHLVRAIQANDANTVMSYFSDSGVTLGAHHRASLDEIRRQFESKTGRVYATFFDTPQLLQMVATSLDMPDARDWPPPKSLRDSFMAADRITIDVEDMASNERLPLWARLLIRWPERPHPAFYSDPSFVLTDSGWKFQTFFTDP